MASLEDMLKGNMLLAVGMGATALLLPKLLPDLSPPLRVAVKSALSLFLEAESEAEGGIIDRLAEAALRQVLSKLSGPGSDSERRGTAETVVEEFKRTAHRRARRYASGDRDRSARYWRHVASLHRHLQRAQRQHKGGSSKALQDMSDGLAAELTQQTHGGTIGPA